MVVREQVQQQDVHTRDRTSQSVKVAFHSLRRCAPAESRILRRTSLRTDSHAGSENTSRLGSTSRIHYSANRNAAKLSPERLRGQGILKSCHPR